MILALAALVVVVVVVVGGFVLTSLIGGERAHDSESAKSRLEALVLVGGIAFVVLLLVIGAGFVLRGSGGGNDVDRAGAKPTPTTTPLPTSGAGTAPQGAPVGHTPIVEIPSALPVVPMNGSDPRRPGPYITIDDLGPDPVVHVVAAGFEPFERGFVELCVSKLDLFPSCAGRFPVQFFEDGGADFQFQVRSTFAPGGCRYGEVTCTVRVTGSASGRTGTVQTVVGSAPPGEVTVTPRSGLHDHTVVEVSVAHFPSDTQATALLCALPGGYDVRRCVAGRTAARFLVGPDGAGKTELDLRTGPVGANGVPCGPRHPCGVLVVSGDGFVAAPSVPLHFARGPGATYNQRRLAAGLTIAVALALSAAMVARRTDWTKPTEAATPDVDAADLQTDSSLDELFGTDAEIEARDPIPS